MDYELKVSQQDTQVLFQALGELPLKVTLNLFAKLQQQIQAQDTARAVPLESLNAKAP